MPKTSSILVCEHGRPWLADCPRCIAEQEDRWRASEAARITDKDKQPGQRAEVANG